jgi:membrane protein DedA with SNARE-associated domain
VGTLSASFIDLIHHAGYAGLFVVMALGNMGMPVGTEIIVPTAGMLAAQGHLSSWVIVGVVATLGEVVGGFILYLVGFYGGEPFVHRWGKYVFFREHELERVHGFYARYGKKTVFICRFVPLVRGIAALPAGMSQMPKRYFLTYTLAGSAIFCFTLAYLGETLGHNLVTVLPLIHRFSLVLAAVVLIALVMVVWLRMKRR